MINAVMRNNIFTDYFSPCQIEDTVTIVTDIIISEGILGLKHDLKMHANDLSSSQVFGYTNIRQEKGLSAGWYLFFIEVIRDELVRQNLAD
jgi:hypothetical protein